MKEITLTAKQIEKIDDWGRKFGEALSKAIQNAVMGKNPGKFKELSLQQISEDISPILLNLRDHEYANAFSWIQSLDTYERDEFIPEWLWKLSYETEE